MKRIYVLDDRQGVNKVMVLRNKPIEDTFDRVKSSKWHQQFIEMLEQVTAMKKTLAGNPQ